MKRIIDKTTGLFLRDDFSFDEETEIGLEVNPAQGLYQPKWENEMWVEGLSAEEIQALTRRSNEQIRELRQQAYKDRSDSLYLAWQKYLVMEDERAEQARQLWLNEVAKIDAEFPYNE